MGGFLVAVAVCIAIGVVVVPWLPQRRQEDLASVATRHGLEHSHLDPFGCTRVASE